ncbi:ATP-binding protein, partial [Streptomyces sp. URMC 123]|uniref:ATP-binding protein n=1 Tax=Streptomyces sp. URMC 123 TaxID=3423403 RepID=UPI003F1996A0
MTLDELALPHPLPSPTWAPLGVGGSGHTTVGVDLITGSHLLLVSGPPGSGRTTAAAAITHSLRRAGLNVLVLAPPRSPLPDLIPDDPGIRVLVGTSHEDADLRAAASDFSGAPYVVLLDDADHLTIVPTQQGFADAPTLLDDI